jgi:adenylate kinase
MRIVLFGAPGSGKGTQGEILARSYGLPRISTGDLLRQAVQDGTPLGRRAEPIMKAGDLVSDDIVIGLVRERIARPDCARGYILDGFPRTIAQAEAIRALDPDRPELVIGLEIDPEVLVERLSGRRVCAACRAIFNLSARPPARPGVCDACGGSLEQRADDTPAAIRERLRVYQVQTEPLKALYVRRGVYRAVSGEGTIEAIAAEIGRIAGAAFATAGPAEARG